MQYLSLVLILVPMEQPGPGSPTQETPRMRVLDAARTRVSLNEQRATAIRELAALEIESQKLTIERLEADVEASAVAIELAANRAKIAEVDLDRARQMAERGVASQREVATAQLERDRSRSDAERARTERRHAISSLAEAKLAVRRTELKLVLEESEAKLQLLDAKMELQRAETLNANSRRRFDPAAGQPGPDGEKPQGDERPRG